MDIQLFQAALNCLSSHAGGPDDSLDASIANRIGFDRRPAPPLLLVQQVSKQQPPLGQRRLGCPLYYWPWVHRVQF
jgi:hypothetical protein